MRCSVIICTRNRPEDVRRCLKSLTKQTLLPQEVIIVDGSDNYNSNKLESILSVDCFEKLNISRKHTKPGLTMQRNAGIKMATGDIIFFFDDDVELNKEYIEKIVEVYKSNHLGNVGGVQGIDLNITDSFLKGKYRLLFYRLFFLSRNDKYAKMLPSGNAVHLDVASPEVRYAKKPIRIYCMSGCIMSYHRKVFNDFKFDESYEGYSHGEDVEFSHRVSRKYKIYFSSHAKAFHNQSYAKKEWYRTEDFVKSNISGQVYRFRKLLMNNPLNYFAILWSWLGLLIWNGIIHPSKGCFVRDLIGMKNEFINIFKPIH